MENRKPPMTIEDLQSQQEAEKRESMKQGPLSYQEAPPKRAAASPGRAPNNIMQTIMSIVLSVALAGGLLYVYADSVQSDLTLVYDTTNEAVAALDETNAAIAVEATRIDNLLNTLTTYAKKSDLTGLATTDQINALQTAINAMDVNNIDKSRLIALEEAVATLTEAIDNWEAPIIENVDDAIFSIEALTDNTGSLLLSFTAKEATKVGLTLTYNFLGEVNAPSGSINEALQSLNLFKESALIGSNATVVDKFGSPSYTLVSIGTDTWKVTSVTFSMDEWLNIHNAGTYDIVLSLNFDGTPYVGYWTVDYGIVGGTTSASGDLS